MNKFLDWINWCVKKEKVLIEQLEKHRLVINALDELAKETKNVWDNMVIRYLKEKIIKEKL